MVIKGNLKHTAHATCKTLPHQSQEHQGRYGGRLKGAEMIVQTQNKSTRSNRGPCGLYGERGVNKRTVRSYGNRKERERSMSRTTER